MPVRAVEGTAGAGKSRGGGAGEKSSSVALFLSPGAKGRASPWENEPTPVVDEPNFSMRRELMLLHEQDGRCEAIQGKASRTRVRLARWLHRLCRGFSAT